MFICPNCFYIYTYVEIRNKKLISNDRLICKDCSSTYLVEIDDGIIDQISIFWRNNIKTQFCCAGHTFDVNRPYLIFKNDNFDELVIFRDKILSIIEPNIVVNEIEDCTINQRGNTISYLGYNSNPDNNNFRFTLEFNQNLFFIEKSKILRNDYINKFSNFLYKIIDTLELK